MMVEVRRPRARNLSRSMLPPDLALALLINRTGQAYTASAPAYIAYTERTHITASIGRMQDINRSVFVRSADNFAVMKDLPDGGERTGQAFPVIPYFDPFSGFTLNWFANLKNVTIDLTRGGPIVIPLPAPDPSASVVILYSTFWAPTYASDSTETAPHFAIAPTSRIGSNDYYPSDVVEDAASQLPSHVEMRTPNSDETIGLDFSVLEGHWVITHGTFSSTEHVGPVTFRVTADTHYDNITFPTIATDPRLAGTPTPKP
jgi:hypothetical protein